MARQALTLAGAAIGAFFGAPQLGFVIGSLVGNAVDPVKTYGPRLTDAKVQTARDGVPINWGAGRFRCAGTLIAVQPGPPTEHKSSSSGKGGGPKTIEYTYTRSHAILVCEGPILGIRRIWRDQKLVYDASEQPTQAYGGLSLPQIVAAWKAGLASSAGFARNLSIYLGDETQMPDAELEALFGVGEVSAHRGIAYVVFKDDDVTERRGSIPNYEFEVVKAGTVVPYNPFPGFQDALAQWWTFDGIDTSSTPGALQFLHYTYSGSSAVASYTTGKKGQNALVRHPSVATPPPLTLGAGIGWAVWVDVDTSVDRSMYVGMGRNSDGYSLSPFWVVEIATVSSITTARLQLYDFGVGYIYSASFPISSGENFFCSWTDGSDFTFFCNGVVVEVLPTIGGFNTDHAQSVGVETTTIDGAHNAQLPSDLVSQGKPDEFGVWQDWAWTSAHASYLYSGGNGLSYSEFINGTSGVGTGGNIPGAPGWTVDEDGNLYPTSSTTTLLAPSGVSLAGFIAEICERSNLAADDFDTSLISDGLDGFLIARETDGGALISMLSSAFFFDAAEFDGRIRFIPRGGDSVMTLTVDDLLAGDPYAIESIRDQEIERPRKVNVHYFDPEVFYIATKQTAERLSSTVAAVGEKSIELPIVFSKDRAAQVAEKLIKISWTDLLGSVNFGVAAELSQLTPTDIIELYDAGATQRLRIEKINDDGGRRMIETRQDRKSAYDSTATGIGEPQNTPYPAPPGATVFMAMNLPSLRSQDSVPGIYLVARGAFAGWRGALVEISYDLGANYETLVSITVASTIGTIVGTVDDPASSPASEIISVQVGGSISSISAAQLAAGGNPFAIVDALDIAEVGQIQNVQDNGSGAYELLDPLRGLLGTAATTHANGERFAMLDQALFVPIDISHAGETIYLRPVTLGTSGEENVAYSLTFLPGDIIVDGGEVTP